MKKIINISVLFLVLSFAAVFQLTAETVDVDELKKTPDDGSIVFKNYSGPHNTIDTIEEIRGIGRYLGRNIEQKPAEFTFYGKYSVIHAVDYSTNEGFDADIFVLSKDASVDHITNLRRMISGFLEEAYEYEIEQADLLAEFITVYNAVHRGDQPYFNDLYKAVVTKHLSPEKTGLALSYEQWPGQTMIVIPLTAKAGDDVISDLDTDILSDEDVVKQLQGQDDKGIEQRQDLVKLKDEEVLEERKAIEDEREQITEKKTALSEDEETLKKESKELEEEKTEESEERIVEIKEKIEDIAEQKEDLAADEQKLEEREKAVEEREDEIVEERREIAEDQMKLIEGEDEAAATDAAPKAEEPRKIESVPFLQVSGDSGSYIGRLLLIDADTGDIVERSDIDSIRLRGYKRYGDEIISVAGSTGGTRIVSLIRIDPSTLEITDSGTAEVYIDSAVVESSGNYYAVVNDNGSWKIGIFDNDFNLESVSVSEVFPATDIVVSKQDVLAQNDAGTIIKLTGDDFTSPSF